MSNNNLQDPHLTDSNQQLRHSLGGLIEIIQLGNTNTLNKVN